MHKPMHKSKIVHCLPLLVAMLLAGCGAGGSSSTSAGLFSQGGSASVFLLATDAPLQSVVTMQLTVNSVTLFNGTSDVSVLTQPAVVDFARLNGLHELIDLNSVPTGTYTSATLTVASPVIRYLDTTQDPPAISTLGNASLSQQTVTVALARPFVLGANALVGLRMELDIHRSVKTDASGQMTGVVDPSFGMQLLNAADAEVSIDNFRGGVVSVTDSNFFVLQGPRGRRWNVTTGNDTDFTTNERVASFTLDGNTIVNVSGQLNPVTRAIDATEVAVLSRDRFVMGGLLTSIRPPSGPASQADLFVRSELPEIPSAPVGQITTLALDGSELYGIANMRWPFLSLLFDNSSIAPGQQVMVGGPLAASGTEPLTPKRVILQRQGQAGGWVPGSTVVIAGNNGTFQLDDGRLGFSPEAALASLLLPNPLTVHTTSETRFFGFGDSAGLASLTGSQPIPIRVVGFVLLNSNHQPVMAARAVERLAPRP